MSKLLAEFKRYDLDPELVAKEVERALKQNEERRIMFKSYKKNPEDAAYVDPMIDSWNDREINYYSKVRVLKIYKGKKPYVLAYGDIDDALVTSGTGGFSTIQKAKDWYLKNGR